MLIKALIIDRNIVDINQRVILDKAKLMIDLASNMQQAILMSDNKKFDIISINEDCVNYKQLFPLLRQSQNHALISVLSDVPDFENELIALKLGADYYSKINKDFVRNVERFLVLYCTHKSDEKKNKNISKCNILILTEYRTVYMNDDYINLTRKEFDLLKLLISDIYRVFTYEIIYNNVWQDDYIVVDKPAIWNLVKRLRKKVNINDQKYIINVHNLGYSFKRY